MLSFPINKLADDGTPINTLLRGDYSILPVIRLSGSASAWASLPTSGFDGMMSVIPSDLSALDNGLYDIGLKVTCRGEAFISHVVKGSVDRNLPEVVTMTPPNGGSVSSPKGIRVTFNEPLFCVRSLATYSWADSVEQEVAVACAGSAVDILFDAAQVCTWLC